MPSAYFHPRDEKLEMELKSVMLVRIAGVVNESVVDGPGIRSVIFFQGCPHACPGCHNPETWDFQGGREFSVSDLIQSLKLTPLISGVTFSGGEPFGQAKAVSALGASLKALGLNLWIYTGFIWEQLLINLKKPGYAELINLADVVVDGPFQQEHKRSDLPFRGSANQRLIRVKASLTSGKVVEWYPESVAI
jgi:anaerobic ribonucleoside-triphosphate reductase activating protein